MMLINNYVSIVQITFKTINKFSICYTDGENVFVREASEFFQKFELIKSIEQEQTVIIDNTKQTQENNIQYCECNGDFMYIEVANHINPLFPTKKRKCKSCGKLKN